MNTMATTAPILLFGSQPEELADLGLVDEFKLIDDLLRKSELREALPVKQVLDGSLDELASVALTHAAAIVHISGHGNEDGELVMREEGGTLRWVGPDQLSSLFAPLASTVRVVVLNSCYSERQARVVAQYVDVVIGMRRELSGEAAKVFSVGLYEAIGQGLDMDRAYQIARSRLLARDPNQPDVPTLSTREGVRADQVRLFDLAENTTDEATQRKVYPALGPGLTAALVLGVALRLLPFDSLAAFLDYLIDPIVLIGGVLFTGFLVIRMMIFKKVIPPLPAGLGFRVLRAVLLYGFIIGLAIVGLGFGLEYQGQLAAQHEERRKRQQEVDETRELLIAELVANQRTLSELIRNSDHLFGIFALVAGEDVLRHPNIPIAVHLFPAANLTAAEGAPAPTKLAEQALLSLEGSGLLQQSLELDRFTAFCAQAAATVDATESTIESLTDKTGTRYVFERAALDRALDRLDELGDFDASEFSTIASHLESIRTNYAIVTQKIATYLSAVRSFCRPDNNTINAPVLVRLLAAERQAYMITTEYGEALVSEAEALEKTIARLRP